MNEHQFVTLATVLVIVASILILLLAATILKLSREIRIYLVARRISELKTSTRPIRPFDDPE